jgi:hypothetical protein
MVSQMTHEVVTESDRALFRRCRRAWDLTATTRRNLEPVAGPGDADVAEGLREALAVYYYPGMWDWDRALVNPLARRGLARALPAREGLDHSDAAAASLSATVLDAYLDWAPGVDDLSPLRIQVDVEAAVADPRRPGADLGLPDRPAVGVRYRTRIDLLAADAGDRLWVIDHRITSGFAALTDLLLDDRALTACWAWEYAYPGVEVAGTMHNELLLDATVWADVGPTGTPPPTPPGPVASSRHAWGVRQNEASGGGRGVRPQRRHGTDDGGIPVTPEVVASTPTFRRTRIPRSRQEVAAAANRLGVEAAEMVDPDLRLYPNPHPSNCAGCIVVDPCLLMMRGQDPEPLLRQDYRPRPPYLDVGRLGGTGWGGRGAALPPLEDR